MEGLALLTGRVLPAPFSLRFAFQILRILQERRAEPAVSAFWCFVICQQI